MGKQPWETRCKEDRDAAAKRALAGLVPKLLAEAVIVARDAVIVARDAVACPAGACGEGEALSCARGDGPLG